MKVVTGSSNRGFAQQLAKLLKSDLVDVEISKFSNGETRVRVNDPRKQLRGASVILVQSFSIPVDEKVMEFLLIADALERLGVKTVSLVNPWMGYSFQDKVFRSGEPIAAKVIADLISESFVDRVFLMDLHNSSIPGFFSIPTHHLSALELFVEHVKASVNLKQAVVVSPDFGGLKRARVFAQLLGLELAEIDKKRDLATGQVSVGSVHGNVKGKTVLIFDDAILSGSTVIETSKLLRKTGAKEIWFLATHGLFVQDAVKKLELSQVDRVVITNTVEQKKLSAKSKVLDASSVFADELKNWTK